MTTDHLIETTAAHEMQDRLRLAKQPVEPDTPLLRGEHYWIGMTLVLTEPWGWHHIRGSVVHRAVAEAS
jgi:hypothetical protein